MEPLVEVPKLVVPLASITIAEAGTAQRKVRSQSIQYWLDSWGTAIVDQLDTVAVAQLSTVAVAQLNIVEVVQLNTEVVARLSMVAAVVEWRTVEAGHKVAEAVPSIAAQLLVVKCRVVVAEEVQGTVAEVERFELE